MRNNRITGDGGTTGVPARMRHGVLFAAVFGGLLTVGQAVAAPETLKARLDTSQESFFTLDFGAFGGERDALLTNTKFQLELDAEANTARFVKYEQNIAPISLPDGAGGEVSTGDIRVEIVPGTSTGVYDADTGEFVTSETYAVHFDGDLSAFGIASPVLLPSESSGVVTFNNNLAGSIAMTWFGNGTLGGFLPFNYACTVNTLFRVAIGSGPVAAGPAIPDAG